MATAIPRVVKQNKTTTGDMGGDTCLDCGRQTKPCKDKKKCPYKNEGSDPKG